MVIGFACCAVSTLANCQSSNELNPVTGLPFYTDTPTNITLEEILGFNPDTSFYKPLTIEELLGFDNTDSEANGNLGLKASNTLGDPYFANTSTSKRQVNPVTGKPFAKEMPFTASNSTVDVDYVPDTRERVKWGVDLNPNNTIYKQQINNRKKAYYEDLAIKAGVGVLILIALVFFYKIVKTAI